MAIILYSHILFGSLILKISWKLDCCCATKNTFVNVIKESDSPQRLVYTLFKFYSKVFDFNNIRNYQQYSVLFFGIMFSNIYNSRNLSRFNIFTSSLILIKIVTPKAESTV
ncbi:hypothetical protein QTP88_009187 [Uroleucon formosanum]